MTASSLDSLLTYIMSVTTPDNRRWLAERLIEANRTVEKEKTLVYPKIPKDWKLSDKVKQMSMGPSPKNFDWEKETDLMWEKMGK